MPQGSTADPNPCLDEGENIISPKLWYQAPQHTLPEFIPPLNFGHHFDILCKRLGVHLEALTPSLPERVFSNTTESCFKKE